MVASGACTRQVDQSRPDEVSCAAPDGPLVNAKATPVIADAAPFVLPVRVTVWGNDLTVCLSLKGSSVTVGGTLSRPTSERICVDESPFGSAHFTEIDLEPSGAGPKVTVFAYEVPENCSVRAGRPSRVMLTVNGWN